MQAGKLDRFVTIQERTVTGQRASGEQIIEWVTLGPVRLPASYSSVRGDERFTAEQYVATEQVEFRIRFSEQLSVLNPLQHRVIYPALEADESDGEPPLNRIFDVMASNELGRREAIRIYTSRRPEGANG